jgi:hypothetical protein
MEGGNRLHNELKGGERATNTLNFLWRLHLDGQSMSCIAQIRSGFVAREKPWQVGSVRKGGDTEATRSRGASRAGVFGSGDDYNVCVASGQYE